MQGKTSKLDIISQFYNQLSNKDKKLFLKRLKTETSNTTNKITSNKTISKCPHCSSTSFTKNGKSGNYQRFICKECNKTFTTTNNTILFKTQKDMTICQKYIHCLIKKYSLRKSAEICGISLPTAFVWKHKILDALQNMQNEVKLNGVVEADETFTPLSFEGHHKDFNLPRPTKHRSISASRRGLSKEQVCITCGVNLNGLSISKVSNLGKPNIHVLGYVLNGKIAKDSVLVTDSFRTYSKLSNDMKLQHIRIPRNQYSLGTFNIQTINSYHLRLKAMLTYNFKGVATKYLNNYLVYNNFVNFAKESRSDKKVILLDFIQETECISQSIDILNRPAIPLPKIA